MVCFRYKGWIMERILSFDELVNIIIYGGEKSVFDSALSSFAGSCMFNENQLYYIAMEYCSQKACQNYSFYSYEANKSVIDNFNKVNNYGFNECQELTLDEWSCISGKTVIIIDDIDFESVDELMEKISILDDNAICIFLGILPINNEFVHPITISVFENNEMDHEEMIYVYSKGESSKMNDINKTLTNSHIVIFAEEQERDKKNIKILEGMLEATEKRLSYYIEKDMVNKQ